MSNMISIRVFYGNEEIRMGPYGVDLGNFPYVDLEHPDPDGWRMPQIIAWLTQYFGLDPESYSVKVQCLWSRTINPVRWELTEVSRTKPWLKWLGWCRRRNAQFVILVQPCARDDVSHSSSAIPVEEEGSSHDVPMPTEEVTPVMTAGHEVVEGDADAGEVDETIVTELENVDGNAAYEEQMLSGGNADEEEEEEEEEEDEDGDEGSNNPIPDDWNRPGKARMEVMDTQRSQWEYGSSKIHLNQLFPNRSELKDAVARWAVTSHREVWVVNSSPKKYTVRCTKEGCNFYVHAYKPKNETHWVASRVYDHSCTLQSVGRKHRNLTAALIASDMYSEIIEKRDMECGYIQIHVRDKFKYEITYQKAWRAKQKALEKRWGTFEASYCNMSRVLDILKERNPGTYVAFKETELEENAPRIFCRAFFALGPCIRSFYDCRPILCIDGTFLTGKYKGQILTAIGIDGNNQILPLAFAFVESENRLSWLWFLRHLKAGAVGGRPNVCIIHDRHAGILSAVKTLQEDPNEPYPWPDLQSRWCMRHMGANFYKYFKNKALMAVFKRLCNQNQTRKFHTLWNELDKSTRDHMEERQRQPQTTGEPLPEPLPPLGAGLDPPNVRRRSARRIKCFSHWIEAEPKEKWSKLYDTDGARYGIMTTNIAEVYNWVIRGLKGLPLLGIIEGILHGIIRYYQKRHATAVIHSTSVDTPYCVRMMNHLAEKNEKSLQHLVRSMGVSEHRFEVTLRLKGGVGSETRVITHEVNLGRVLNGWCDCTCNKPRLLHIPCSHVLAALSQVGVQPSLYVSPFYMKEALIRTWTGEFHGFVAHFDFTEYDKDAVICLPHMSMLRHTSGKGGRPATRRIRNDMDEAEVGGPMRRCTECGEHGHKIKNCPRNKSATDAPATDGAGTSRAQE